MTGAKRGKMRLALVLLLIGRESDASFTSQSQNEVKQNQSKAELFLAFNWKPLYYVTSSTFFIQIIVQREMATLSARHMEKMPTSGITFWNVAHFLADDNRRFNRIVTPSCKVWWALRSRGAHEVVKRTTKTRWQPWNFTQCAPNKQHSYTTLGCNFQVWEQFDSPSLSECTRGWG